MRINMQLKSEHFLSGLYKDTILFISFITTVYYTKFNIKINFKCTQKQSITLKKFFLTPFKVSKYLRKYQNS